MNRIFKKIIGILSLVVLLGIIITIFWIEEFQYYQELSPPENYPTIQLLDTIKFQKKTIKCPAFIHFYDENCDYSKINLGHLQFFLPDFQDKLFFYVVCTSDINSEKFRKKYQIPDFVNILPDTEQNIVKSCGVYTTPHAVLIDENKRLYFSGNYNSQTGLCSPNNISNSAPAMALLFFSKQADYPIFPPFLVRAWGCPIQ